MMSATLPPDGPDMAAAPLVIGNRFEVIAVLGRGGMGTVYRVRDRESGQLLALKRVAFDAAGTARTLFEREYVTLARLNHPLIIEVYDYALEAGGAYYTMELLDGDDLSRIGPQPYPRVCRHMRQVATTLALLHAQRLVHRDLSPRNVRVTQSDECKLLDFGALAAFGDVGVVIGTPPCVPPEAMDQEELDQRVDLYGLGCLAYYELTGRHAYPANQVEQLPSYWAQPIEAPSRVVAARQANDGTLPAVPPELDELVLSLLHLDRSARPTSAGTVIDQLNVILGRNAGDELELASSYVASAPTIGREQQLMAAAKCTEQLLHGHGEVLVFEGLEGSGKTQLLREIALATRVSGASVVMVDARAGDRPYATARALCRALFDGVGAIARKAATPHAALLCQIVPELAAKLGIAPPEAPANDGLWNNRAQLALRGFILEVCRQTPLALLLDNMHDCDHPSATLIATLAHETKQHPMLMIATLRPEVVSLAAASCRALRAQGEVLGVENLSALQLEAWCDALFGRNTPNLPRLRQFVYAQTSGQPSDMVELLYAMLHAKDIRYNAGTWVLPLQPANNSFPVSAAQAMLARLAGLGEGARGVAGALCLYRGMLSRSLCHVLCEVDETTLALSLRELLDARILVQQRDNYTFSHDTIRDALREHMPAAERVRLQRRIAEVILARDAPQVSERLDAGLHLFEAEDERGVQLLCQGGVALALNPEGIGDCVPILERALELAKTRGRSQLELATLLAPLAVSAYVFDRRLERYTTELIVCFAQLTGLNIAARLRPWLGKHVSTLFGLTVGFVRHALTPRRVRHTSFRNVVQMFIGSIMGLCGKSAICLDGPGLRKLAARIEPLTIFGKAHASHFAHDYCQALSLVTQDRHSETYAFCQDLERRLHTPSMVKQTTAELRRLWQGGMHYVLGLFESFASDPQVLVRAEHLEKSEFGVDRLIAAQLRRIYYTFRGEAEALRRANAQVEACAVQTGSSWQVETWSAIVTNYAASLWGDTVDAKRAVDETERLAIEMPSLARYAQSSRAVYQLELGQPRLCATIYEHMLTLEKPRERIGWSVSTGLLASAYNELGDSARALKVCDAALRELLPADAYYAGMRLPIASARLFALASLGQHAEAERYFNELLALYSKNASPLVLGTLHESAARMAWLRGDRKAFTQHIKEVEHYFCPLGQAALIGRFLKLTALGGSEGEMSAQIASMREVKAFDNALAALSDRDMLARHAFVWLMQKCDGFEGYLFVKDDAGPQLLASNDDRDPPEAARELARRGLGAMSMEDITTHCGPVELNTQAARPGAKKHATRLPAEVLHVHLLSFVDQGRFCGEGALVLRGSNSKPPRLRYDLLQVAAKHLRRVQPNPTSSPVRSTPPTDHSAMA